MTKYMTTMDLLSNEGLIDIVSTEYRRAKEYIAEHPPDDELYPTLLVLTDDELTGERSQQSLIVHVFADFDEDRYKVLRALGIQLGQAGHIVLLAVLTTEAWMSRYNDEDARRVAKEGPPVAPRNDPNRIEVAVTIGIATGNRRRCLWGEIHRKDNGRSVIDIEPLEEGGEEIPQSDLVMAFWRGYAVGLIGSMVKDEPT